MVNSKRDVQVGSAADDHVCTCLVRSFPTLGPACLACKFRIAPAQFLTLLAAMHHP
jgi:hypothetical protein